MIDHITFHTRDIEATKKFYAAVLATIGYSTEVIEFEHEGVRIIGFTTKEGKTDTWFSDAKPTTGPGHVAWKAKSQEEVDAFYTAGLSNGGKDNGAPGIRAEYSPTYYAAFVIDPDGNNIEVAIS